VENWNIEHKKGKMDYLYKIVGIIGAVDTGVFKPIIPLFQHSIILRLRRMSGANLLTSGGNLYVNIF